MEASQAPTPEPERTDEPSPTHLTEAGSGSQAPEAPTTQLVGGAVGDRCTNCKAPLASDQSYCVNCGERRGKARFSFASVAPEAQAAKAARPPRDPRRPRFSSSATLIAGIGTLLLAMGVGVLIGEQGKTKATPAASTQPPLVITQGGGGSTSAASTHNATTTPSGTHSHSSAKAAKHSNSSGPKTVVITKKVQAKAQAAAQKVLGGGNNINNTATVGGGCSNSQAGCQNGKFTGNFFGSP